MTPAKETDGELWVKAVDAYHMSDLAHEAGKAVGAAAEREACAKFAEQFDGEYSALPNAIRARGQA